VFLLITFSWIFHVMCSGEPSSGRPWIKLIMMLVQRQLIPLSIMRWVYVASFYWYFFLLTYCLTLVHLFFNAFLSICCLMPHLLCCNQFLSIVKASAYLAFFYFSLLSPDCQIFQQWSLWSWAIWWVLKEWVVGAL
jgi:hypothetical protein